MLCIMNFELLPFSYSLSSSCFGITQYESFLISALAVTALGFPSVPGKSMSQRMKLEFCMFTPSAQTQVAVITTSLKCNRMQLGAGSGTEKTCKN